MLQQLLRQKNINVKRCSVALDIPYSTLSDLVRGITPLSRASGEILYKLARFFGVSMEDLIKNEMLSDGNETWTGFKSNVLHELKTMGDREYIRHMVKDDVVFGYWNSGRKAEAMYLAALTDYLCRIHGIVPFTGFDEIRRHKLKGLLYPLDAELSEEMGLNVKREMLENSIPEFLHYNIVEGDIRNVC